MAQAVSRIHFSRRRLLALAVLVIGLYVLVPQLGDFRSSWHLLRHPSTGSVLIAIGFTALTYLAAALTYYWLAFRPLSYARTLIVQLAAMFINRLLPAGIGALGVNYSYLRQAKHTSAQAATVAGVNNLLGFVGNFLLIAIVLAASGSHAAATTGHSPLRTVGAVSLVIVVGLLIASLVAGKRFRKLLGDIRRQVFSYRRRPAHLVGALSSSMVLTLCNVLAFYYCATALGVHVSFAAALLILTFGVGTGAATPTPGGLGGFEAGLVAGLVAYHVDSSAALAVALLYRLISYWLVLAVGAVAFVICQRRHWLGF